ncbi:MAG: M10 family metallopeptidase C-terminal domain-containing protein, partial [Micropepsaceae bacterium]
MKKVPKKFWQKEPQDTDFSRDHSSSATARNHEELTPVQNFHDDALEQSEVHHRPAHADGSTWVDFDDDDRHSRHLGSTESRVHTNAHAAAKIDAVEQFDAISPPKPLDINSNDAVLPSAVFTRATPNIIETADAAGNTGTVYQLQIGQSAQGTLGVVGDRDWFAVDLQANQIYSFAMTGTGSNNVIDPYLRLMSSNGLTELLADDDSLVGNNSLFTFTPTTTGRYYIAAGAFDDLGTGQYGITVTAGARPSFDAPMGAGVIDADSAWTATPGTGATVTYAFRQSPATYTAGGSDISTFTQLTATEITAVRLALQAWSEVSGLTFVEVNPGGYSNNATMLFGNYTDANDGAGAFAYFPGSTASTAQAGDVWLNTTSISTNSAIDYGSYSYNAIMHEIGHAIGLSHPGLYNAAPGVSITYANNAQFTQDTNQFSIMSYFDEANTGSQFLGYPESPMLFDVYSIQQIYGANLTTRVGDTIYGFNSNAGALYNFSTNVNAAFTIWDGGGIDTIDASGYATDQIIDLNEGGFSTIGSSTFNIAIAVGVQIENAIGGVASDTITGNAANNNLSGGSGVDVISGGDGNDTLNGGAGADTLITGRGQDIATGGLDFDTFQLDFVLGVGLQSSQITDLAAGEAISWTALQTSIVGGTPVSFVGPIVFGDGTSTALNHIDFATTANSTILYFGLDNTAGADFNLTINGLFGIGQFGIEQNNAIGAVIRLQSSTTSYSLSPAATSVSEGVGTATFTVTRSGETPAETVFVSTTAAEGFSNNSDFTAIADQAVTFAAGELTKTVTVAITNDTVFENNETFGLVVQ